MYRAIWRRDVLADCRDGPALGADITGQRKGMTIRTHDLLLQVLFPDQHFENVAGIYRVLPTARFSGSGGLGQYRQGCEAADQNQQRCGRTCPYIVKLPCHAVAPAK